MDQLITTPPLETQATQDDNSCWRIAFVQSGWHHEIVAECRVAFLAQLESESHNTASVDVYDVPGAFEIPLRVKILAQSGKYAAIVACGFVVDGGIYRHEFVATAVINALMTIQIEAQIPIISAVLTPQHFHDHEEHRAFFTKHFAVKGIEAANACWNTLVGHIAVLKLSTAA